MNRLIIVGNGFDLAHGLPTGYCDFIDWYWNKVISELVPLPNLTPFGNTYKDDIIEIKLQIGINSHNDKFPIVEEYKAINSYKSLTSFIEKYKRKLSLDYDDFYGNFDDSKITFKNSFFKIINDLRFFKNWVDIENEYYKLLKKCLEQEGNNSEVKKLNQHFEQVKDLLEEYLRENICIAYDFTSPNSSINKIKDVFNIWNRYTEKDKFYGEFSIEDRINIAKYDSKLRQYNNSGLRDITAFIQQEDLIVQNIFVNFNYTPTLEAIVSTFKNDEVNYYGTNTIISIHGKIDEPDNKINFGFGDEMDEHYRLLEEKDDNEYLKNIKSFQYLQNCNYRDLLNFIEGNTKFQVYLFGHSCGLSDRILLNTIFEHPNCRSIKVFYHEKDGTDNYTEIVQNISRHFNKKKLMREKIVNKSLCQPLPQDIRFAKK